MSSIEEMEKLLKRKILKDKVGEFVDCILKELSKKEGEFKLLQEKYDELLNDNDYDVHVISGLDTIYIKLERCNIEIQDRVDKFIKGLKMHYNATES